MPETRRWKIDEHKREIAECLNELDEADDAALWEKASAKLHDVLLMHRRAARNPKIASLSDEQLAQIGFQKAVERFLRSRRSVRCSLRKGNGA